MGRNIVCLVVFISVMITTSRTYENAAAGKSSTASQSSTDGSHSAALAFDGGMGQNSSNCSRTQEENQPWWQVDLGKDHIVFAVKIWNLENDSPIKCQTTKKGEEYRGTIYTTEDGATCDKWSNHPSKDVPPGSVNYCRNPDKHTGPWCYVPNDHWKDCKVPMCKENDLVPKCRITVKGKEYRGTINTTPDGATCKDWSKTKYNDELAGSLNYCRNPDDGDGPWCYKPGGSYSYCKVPMCEERLSNFEISLDEHRCHHYNGTVANGGSPEITCDTPVIGRILKIQLLDYTFLTLCEVSVRGSQYQETPTVSELGPSSPTSMSVQWPNIVPIDSASDIVIKYYVVYQQLPMASQTQQLPASKGMNATISGLQPSTKYSISLKIEYSYNGRAKSSQGQMTTLRTDSCENHMVTPVLMVDENAIDIALPWPNRAFLTTRTEVRGMLPGCITYLDIYYKATRDTSFKQIRDTAPSYKMQNLIPFTEYDVIPSVVSPDGKVRNGTSIKITTAEDIPPAPSVIKTGVGPTSISLKVIPPNPSYGIITNYSLEMSEYNGESRTVYLGPTDTFFAFDKLKFKTQYTFWAKAFTSEGAGDQSEAVTIVTEESIPGPPNTLEVTEQTTSSLVLSWTQPKFQSGTLLDYKLTCSPLFSYDENINKANHSNAFNPAPHVNKLKVSGLIPATEYNCSVAAQTSKGYGPSVWLRNWTKPEDADVPENLFLSIFPDRVTDTTITVQVNKMPKMLKTGSVSKLQIAVEKFGQGRRKRSIPLQSDEQSKYTDHATAKEKGYPGYIAAELAANFSGPFIIGDGKTYDGYYNAPLEKGQSYDVIFGMVFEVGELSTVAYRRYGEPIKVGAKSSTGQAVGLAVGILIMAALIVLAAVIIYRRRLRGNKPPDTRPFNEESHDTMRTREHTMENIYDAVVPTPGTSSAGEEESDPEHCIFISNLISYVKAIRGERAEEFTQEFESLPKNIVKSVQQATSAANLPLNRYKNIVAYDHSRVILQPVGEEKSDYINATFIHGYQEENIFIASQGPLSSTIPAMWRMIWQERCATVVMLTNLKEMGKPKCEQYWPDKERATYGPFTVQLAEEYKFTDYVKRILTVTLNAEVHTVKHFHFTAWPDHDVPKFACSLLNFRRQVFLETEYGKAPIVVHCSAGAGRTGTFIGIDYLIRQGKAEHKVNFYECVLRMREQRANMVQNIGQYTHLHDAVLEFFKVGITYIQSSFYPEEYLNLIKPSPNKQTCRLQQQYSLLAIFTDAITPSEKAICHSVKNRNQDIVPEDKSRVVLSLPVNGWNDYVNAVYASGYGEKDTYIITQMPLPETMKDIWRIVHDTGVSTIVMMNLVDYEHCTVYWPMEMKPLEFGPLVVEGVTTDTSNSDITVRDFRISKKNKAKGGKCEMGRLIRHFQLQNWRDGQATPSSPESIVELLEMVGKWQQKVENKKILVHCLDGASQSGVFCVAHSIIEKVKVDHEVDVFQYLRLLRSNRPQLVNTYEQYKFIHEVVLSYLQGFDIYANFQ